MTSIRDLVTDLVYKIVSDIEEINLENKNFITLTSEEVEDRINETLDEITYKQEKLIG